MRSMPHTSKESAELLVYFDKKVEFGLLCDILIHKASIVTSSMDRSNTRIIHLNNVATLLNIAGAIKYKKSPRIAL